LNNITTKDYYYPIVPGYGFSDVPGDWGTSITEQIALYHSDLLSGIHLTDVPFSHLFTTRKRLKQIRKKIS
ncbi:MAG: hypothetical protein M3139_15560, partial [Bacteroidota bacterium]|nr:hypothetical protein [Bacteroidota bacterium]